MFGKTIEQARESLAGTLEPLGHSILVALYAIGALLVIAIAVMASNGN